ncbi:Eukaryotic translation initiation factor 5 [Heterocephalus glaber]|uniref:Eukaryotic translation initiation factor 5 n=1 Tax=Heterocephalus glaber TaxID=10181 RepID=G5AUC6_HETGA|nr:Eukaryotic translation initiation factor 5 [Heterocephalus glaber]
MPHLIAKFEGKGNGTKTVIVNMVDITEVLKCPPMYPTKYSDCELGAQTEMDNAHLREEEVIISWSEKASKKYVSKELAKDIHLKAEPFIKWLKEAEEESSGGEEDDEDANIQVVYSKTASVPEVETVKSENKDDNIDIDAI